MKLWRDACNIEKVSAIEIKRARAACYTLVYRMNVLTDQSLITLRENDLEHNTLVVYMSNYGEPSASTSYSGNRTATRNR